MVVFDHITSPVFALTTGMTHFQCSGGYFGRWRTKYVSIWDDTFLERFLGCSRTT